MRYFETYWCNMAYSVYHVCCYSYTIFDPQPMVFLRMYYGNYFSGFDFSRKRAHPDVFTGKNPQPVTIHDDSDWKLCIDPKEQPQ